MKINARGYFQRAGQYLSQNRSQKYQYCILCHWAGPLGFVDKTAYNLIHKWEVISASVTDWTLLLIYFMRE